VRTARASSVWTRVDELDVVGGSATPSFLSRRVRGGSVVRGEAVRAAGTTTRVFAGNESPRVRGLRGTLFGFPADLDTTAVTACTFAGDDVSVLDDPAVRDSIVWGRARGAADARAGGQPLFAPLKGGTLVAGLVTDARGTLSQGGAWPPGIPSGFVSWLQVWGPDPAAPTGLSATNGLALVTP